MIAFSSTRTVSALGMAAQKGGFVIRDMIHWCYFSGFPKSHDISKAIDREAGAVREVVGKGEPWNRPDSKAGDTVRMNASPAVYDITKPATQDAQKWDGFGTALKPAVEPALLLRKPLEKGLTIAQNVLKHGTGALNIDGCRFGYGDPCWVGSQEDHSHEWQRKQSESSSVPIVAQKPVDLQEYKPKGGRWPANLYQCAKASRSEREEGLDHLEAKSGADTVHRKEDICRAPAGALQISLGVLILWVWRSPMSTCQLSTVDYNGQERNTSERMHNLASLGICDAKERDRCAKP